MSDDIPDSISVVISTFERPDACERALRSALGQSDAPLEVLVCDNGSRDDTPARFRGWEEHCDRVRYLRLQHNSGTPAPPRNLGIAHARGDWVAFLDDDDEWLPEKLARQRIAMRNADVIATNALRRSGGLYFPGAPATSKPSRAEMLVANPVIVSSAIVRRSLAGFPISPRLRGIEDYAAWLTLADRGVRFVVLGEPLVLYEDASAGRMSTARARMGLAAARLAWVRALRPPIDPASIRAALRMSAVAMHITSTDGLAAARTRVHRNRVRR